MEVMSGGRRAAVLSLLTIVLLAGLWAIGTAFSGYTWI